MKFQLLAASGLLAIPQVTAFAEYYFGNCAGEAEAGPIGNPSLDKTFHCFMFETNDIDCSKLTNAYCEEGKNACEGGFNTFLNHNGVSLSIVDCDDMGHTAYDGSEPPPDGTHFANLVFTDTGVTAGSCFTLAYGGDSQYCAGWGSEECGIGYMCQELNG